MLMPVLNEAVTLYNDRHKVRVGGGLDGAARRALCATAIGLQFERWIGDTPKLNEPLNETNSSMVNSASVTVTDVKVK